MTRPRKTLGASGIRTRDLPLSRQTPLLLSQRDGCESANAEEIVDHLSFKARVFCRVGDSVSLQLCVIIPCVILQGSPAPRVRLIVQEPQSQGAMAKERCTAARPVSPSPCPAGVSTGGASAHAPAQVGHSRRRFLQRQSPFRS